MKLAHPAINNVFDFDKGKICVLSIENPKLFSRLLIELLEQIDNSDGTFVLSDKNSGLNIPKKMLLIDNIFKIDSNQRTLITTLYKNLAEKINKGEFTQNFNMLKTALSDLMINLTLDMDAEIITESEIDFNNIFKSVGLRFNDDFDDLSQKTLEYMMLVREFDCDKCFVFLNLKSFLEPELLEHFYKEVLAREFKVLLLEGAIAQKSPLESITVIDYDLCEISNDGD